MPLVVRFAEIAGLASEESSEARDIGTAEFLSIATDVWEALRPEFRAEKLTVYETFPGEHLGGRRVEGGEFVGEETVNPSLLRILAGKTGLTSEGRSAVLRIHSNHSIEVEGLLAVEGLPHMLAILQLNLYRAWAEGSSDWPGAGDAVFEIQKSGSSHLAGLWEACSEHPQAMVPVLRKWIEGVSQASRPHDRGKHRIHWAALSETGVADEPPISGVFALYRSRVAGKSSLLAANLKVEAADELSDLIGASPDPFEKAAFRQAVAHEIDSMTITPAFPPTADRFQEPALVVYGQGGSEYFVFRDPQTPRRAARDLVRAVRPKLRERVLEHMVEGQAWNATLSGLRPPHADRRRRGSLAGWE